MASKELKLYIPIITPNKKKILVGVHNCTEIKKVIPSNREIGEHLLIQNVRRVSGQFVNSINVILPEEKFKILQKELSRKVGASYRSSTIDIIIEETQYPIIQIAKKNE